MAWSDAARRAAVLARRLKRVQNYQPKNYDQAKQRRSLMVHLGERTQAWRENARAEASRSRALRREATYERAKRNPTPGNIRMAERYSDPYRRAQRLNRKDWWRK